MFKAQVFTWPTQGADAHLREDAHFIDAKNGVFVVADGVTRDRDEQGIYPYPSPAAGAALAAAENIGRALLLMHEGGTLITKQEMAAAFESGNGAVRAYSTDSGFWDNHDYLLRDLPGAVASALTMLDDATFTWGYIGDCGAARIRSNGQVRWHTPDDVTDVRQHFPKADEMSRSERNMLIRQNFRNKPGAGHPTYGVLTGEEEALRYVKTGIRSYDPGDLELVYSDGIAPFIFNDATFRQLLVHGSELEIYQHVADRSSATQHADEKTLIVVRGD
jgi:hypothetical protein